MEALGVFFVLCLLVQQNLINADLEGRELKAAESIHRRRRESSAFAKHFDAAFAHMEKRLKKNSFVCPTLNPSPTVPTTVHELRPSDIKNIAAIGDSLTAGRGIENGEIGLLVDYRGLSWSIGGNNNFYKTVTVPNILRIYNPNLYGYSESIGSLKPRFNVAISGAKSGSALSQAQELFTLMKEDRKVDMDNDWKLITIFIGGNDLCDYCEDTKAYSSTTYKENLKAALDYIEANFKRTYVNLVEMLNVEFVTEMKQNFLCTAVLNYVCRCAAFPENDEDEAKLIKLREEYQAVARELAADPRYTTRDDFAVVLQPFYRNTTVPRKANGEVDLSYFAADCFHFSKKGHTAAAEALWNNMFEPVGSKRTAWTPGEAIECPTEEHPYLYTAQNSKTRSPNRT